MTLKFVRGCEKNRDMQALETFLSKYPRFVEPDEETYVAVLKAISNSYIPPERRAATDVDADEESVWTYEPSHQSTREIEKASSLEKSGHDWIYLYAWTLFHSMPRHKIKRSRPIYDSMIELASKRASIKRATILLREMEQEAEKEQNTVPFLNMSFKFMNRRNSQFCSHRWARQPYGPVSATTGA